MQKIKVWGATHPDEKMAAAFVDSLYTDPIPNVTPGIANPYARALGKRMVDTNLISAFPGDPDSALYESRRAVEVLQESQGYDVVVDLHNMNYFGENTAMIDIERGVNPAVLGFIGSLGIKNLVATEYGLSEYIRNAFTLETLASGLGGDFAALRHAINDFANKPHPPHARAADFRWFANLGGLHIKQSDPTCLGPDSHTIKAFEELPATAASALGFDDIPTCLMSWRNAPNELGYWGQVVTPVAVPDDRSWPE